MQDVRVTSGIGCHQPVLIERDRRDANAKGENAASDLWSDEGINQDG